jgi:double-stranded uracil-DNA glycosylase
MLGRVQVKVRRKDLDESHANAASLDATELTVSSGFRPIATLSAQVLILGSLPGAESLRRQQYYAQPRNAFWRIMGDLFGVPPDQPYALRTEALNANDVAVWDVCASAYRQGSLDAAIDLKSVLVNDFKTFYIKHPRIRLICFNGKTAAAVYEERVIPLLSEASRAITRIVLPSTSPAHASFSYEKKRETWEALGKQLTAQSCLKPKTAMVAKEQRK